MRWLGLLLAGAALAGSPQLGHAEGAPLTVVVTGLRFGGGSVRVDVCTPDTFLKGACPYSGAAPAVRGSTAVEVEDVPPGTYAVQAYHDFNDNHRVDRGPLGAPREGIAFSNDAPLGLHGPSFARAAFGHGEAPQTLTMKLRHFRRPPPDSGR